MYPLPSTRSLLIVHEQAVKGTMDRARDRSGRKETHPDRNGIVLLLKSLEKRQKSQARSYPNSLFVTALLIIALFDKKSPDFLSRMYAVHQLQRIFFDV
jgi:hypothetical protein